MGAATAAFLSLERPAHVVAPSAMYGGLRECLKEDAPGHVSEVTVGAEDNEAMRAAIRPGQIRLVWIEMPPTPIWTVTETCGGRSLRSRSRRPSGGALHRTDPGPDSANPIERSLSVL